MQKQTKKTKIVTAILVLLVLAIGVGVGAVFYIANLRENVDDEPEAVVPAIYSRLTGKEIDDASLNQSPTFCVQIPNGSTDGARPQAGLTDAAVVFEAIAEGGITRFAAIFQNPTVGVIGPIRSLRPYYLEWDTPFDCTVVHAGGSDEALAEIAWGGQRNLDESTVYMWREDTASRRWNNLFTSPTLLTEFNLANNYQTSNPKVFARMTPEQETEILAALAREKNAGETDEETSGAAGGAAGGTAGSGTSDANGSDAADTNLADAELASEIFVDFSWNSSHNVYYIYDAASNSYLRYHQDGAAHVSYVCPQGATNTTTDCGEPVQVAPKAVVVMRVYETLMADNYHESIQTTGTGVAEIFQNGMVIHGSWTKTATEQQIVFRDGDGKVVDLVPGQLWIMAVPQSGGLAWE